MSERKAIKKKAEKKVKTKNFFSEKTSFKALKILFKLKEKFIESQVKEGRGSKKLTAP